MNFQRISIVLSVISFLFVSCSVAKESRFSFDFSNDLSGWVKNGDGLVQHLPGIGHGSPGSLRITCNKGQTATISHKFNMVPGRYKVTAWLRAFEVGEANYSLWLFYMAGKGYESPVKNLHGTFEWSKITYTIDVVKEQKVYVWFRLKSQGSVWVDDVTIESYQGEIIDFKIEQSNEAFPKLARTETGARCSYCYRWNSTNSEHCKFCGEALTPDRKNTSQGKDVPHSKVLLNFEEADRVIESKRSNLKHFSDAFATSGKHSAEIEYGQYNNVTMLDPEMKDWSGYDYLKIDVFNPLPEKVPFALAIADTQGGGYWNQLNHYATLVSGWNKLAFQINRYVGERGSVRHHRYLDLAHLTRFWFSVSPEAKDKKSGNFLVDNLRLETADHVSGQFEGLHLYDFVKENIRGQEGFVGVESRHNYSEETGFGFINADIWRTHDSIYADTLYRDGIFINSGAFRVDVANGKYIVRCVPFALGVWNEHFWTRRKIRINNQVVLDEKRRSADDYMRDYLRFEDIEPLPNDTVYDVYLNKIFQEIVTEVSVSDGKILFDFDADNSGILLNSIIIYPVERRRDGASFCKMLRNVQQNEFNYIIRKLSSDDTLESQAIVSQDSERGFYTGLIGEDTLLRYNQIKKSAGSQILLQGGRLERPVQALMVRNLRKHASLFTITSSPLVSDSGETLIPGPEWLRYGVNQYQSHTGNHESYELAPRYLQNISPEGLNIEPDYSRLIWFQLPITKQMKPGRYRGWVNISSEGETVSYPVSLTIHAFQLPPVDIAAGFFGLDPIGFNYYQGKGVSEKLRENRVQVLSALQERGFSTWSSLPKCDFTLVEKSITFRCDEVDELMKDAQRHGFDKKVFTYGGNLPIHLRYYGQLRGVRESRYRSATSEILKRHMTSHQWLPVVFDISDEASGYSQMVKRDMGRVQMLQSSYPYLRRGGYTHPIKDGEYGARLNDQLTDISLLYFNEDYIDRLNRLNRKWGVYNQAGGLFENNRLSFGRLLFAARHLYKCDHFLEWFLTGAQNYPYYDLDGRENDAMMIFPHADGTFSYAIKFEWASQGIEDYRLLTLLKRLAEKSHSEDGKTALEWINNNLYQDRLGERVKLDRKNFPRASQLDNKTFRDSIYKYINKLILD